VGRLLSEALAKGRIPDAVYACGANGMLKAIDSLFPTHPHVYLSLEERIDNLTCFKNRTFITDLDTFCSSSVSFFMANAGIASPNSTGPLLEQKVSRSVMKVRFLKQVRLSYDEKSFSCFNLLGALLP
jgi:hypothetical protein